MATAIQTLNIKRFLIILSIIFLIICVAVVITLSIYTREKALHELANQEAQKTAEMVRQSLYSVMRKGWNRNDINDIIQRLNAVDENIDIRAFRGEIVNKQFGRVPEQQQIIDKDEPLKNSLMSGEKKILSTPSGLRFLFPVKAAQECMICHTESRVGGVHGIIDISFKADYLNLPLVYFSRPVVIFLFFVFCLLFFIPFYFLRAEVIRPITHMVTVMHDIMNRQDLSLRLDYQGHVTEFKHLSGFINEMLRKLEISHRNLENQATHDHLTKLFNRRKFEDQLSYEIQRAKRYNREFTLVMLDLDNFKQINDTYGHATGDNILKNFADILLENVRISDLVARLGGDEFCILLPETDSSLAKRVSRNIQHYLTTNPIELNGDPYTPSCSIGIVTYPKNGNDAKSLMLIADETMYKAKTSGHNLIAVPEL